MKTISSVIFKYVKFFLFFFLPTPMIAQDVLCMECLKLDSLNDELSKKRYKETCFKADTIFSKGESFEVKIVALCERYVKIERFTKGEKIPYYSIDITNGLDTIYGMPDVQARFKGGQEALNMYLNGHIIYPKEAIKSQIEGRVVVYFEITKKGEVVNVKILKKVNYLLDDEALRVIKDMPKWHPAKYNDKVVHSRIAIPIKFTLPITDK